MFLIVLTESLEDQKQTRMSIHGWSGPSMNGPEACMDGLGACMDGPRPSMDGPEPSMDGPGQ